MTSFKTLQVIKLMLTYSRSMLDFVIKSLHDCCNKAIMTVS